MITPQERVISRELSVIYATYFAILGAIKMSADWGSVPQWLTAIAAAIIAGVTIYTQRDIARKRAAVDVFIKTEMDEKMIEAYERFNTGIAAMSTTGNIEEFCKSENPHYLAIRKYLNVHELIAVGIKHEVLDKDVCYHYWCDTLTNGYRNAKPLIEYLLSRPENKYTYSDLRRLNFDWLKRMKTDPS
jgi:hypothetical protein